MCVCACYDLLTYHPESRLIVFDKEWRDRGEDEGGTGEKGRGEKRRGVIYCQK